MGWRQAAGAAALAGLFLGTPSGAEGRKSAFNWDALGAEFCARTLAGDLAGLQPILSESLVRSIEFTFADRAEGPPQTLFQSYVNVVPVCAAKTRNAAIVEITRSGAGGAAPAWTEYLVVVPQIDGTTRIDDVLFATQRSDTLRNRLNIIAAE